MSYYNKNASPKVFRSTKKGPISSNKTHARINYVHQFIQQQEQVNQYMTENFKDVNQYLKETKAQYHQQYQLIISKLENHEKLTGEILQQLKDQETPTNQIINRLSELEKLTQELVSSVQNDEVVNEAIMEQLSFQDQSTNRLSRTLEEFGEKHKELIEQQKQQAELYEDIDKNLKVQESFHQTILKELDQQKALTQKLNKQFESLKDYIHEKVTSVTKVVEEQYHSTSQFLQNVVAKTGFIKSINRRAEKEEVKKE